MKEKLVPEEDGTPPEPIPAWDKQDERSPDDVISWIEFTENTTFHGVKYIFDDKPYRIRRALWFVCVMAAVTVFLLASITRLRDYLQHESTVNLEMVYNEPLEFPAVTICNQNSFRLTKAVDYKIYEYIDEFLSDQENATLDRFGSLSHINLPKFVLDSAHRKPDFIDDCLWRRGACRNFFTQVMTDAGVCYTFTPPPQDRVVTNPGSGSGLHLVLNVEQYEYMKGFQNDVGVKVLLHSRTEKPRVRDQGFVVEPGKHTLVAITRTELQSMEAPYGRCVKDAEPLTTCQLRFESGVIKKVCNCTSIYMTEDLTDPTICKIRNEFECAHSHVMGNIQSSKCSLPCQRITFVPSLSSALLSKYTINRVALSDYNRRTAAKKRFLRARDISQKAIKSIRGEDNARIDKTWGHAIKLRNLTIAYVNKLTDSASLAKSAGVPNIIDSPVREQFTDTRPVVEDVFRSRQKQFMDLPAEPNLHHVRVLVDRMSSFFSGPNPVLMVLKKCMASGTLLPSQKLLDTSHDGKPGSDNCPPPPPPPAPLPNHLPIPFPDTQQHQKKDLDTNVNDISSDDTPSTDFEDADPSASRVKSETSDPLDMIESKERNMKSISKREVGSGQNSFSFPDDYSGSSLYSGDYSNSGDGGFSSDSQYYPSDYSNSYPSYSSQDYSSDYSSSYPPYSSQGYPSDYLNSYPSYNSSSYPSSSLYGSSDYGSPWSPSSSSTYDYSDYSSWFNPSSFLSSFGSSSFPSYSSSSYYGSSNAESLPSISSHTTGDPTTEVPFSTVSDTTQPTTSKTTVTPEASTETTTAIPPDTTTVTPGSSPSTCLPVEASGFASGFPTMAAIKPSCITLFTSSSVYTFNHLTSASQIYYPVFSGNDYISNPYVSFPFGSRHYNSIPFGSFPQGAFPTFPPYPSYPNDGFPPDFGPPGYGDYGDHHQGDHHQGDHHQGGQHQGDQHQGEGSGYGTEDDSWMTDQDQESEPSEPPPTIPPDLAGKCESLKYLACHRGGPVRPSDRGKVHRDQFLGFRSWYLETVAKIFDNRTQMYNNSIFHKKCLTELDDLDKVLPNIGEVFSMAESVQKAETVQELHDALEVFENSSGVFKKFKSDAQEVDLMKCMWFKKYWVGGNGRRSKAEDDIQMHVQSVQQANLNLMAQGTEVQELGSALISILSYLDSKVFPNFYYLTKYRNNTFYKTELVAKYDQFQMQAAMANMKNEMDDFKTRGRTVYQVLVNTRNGITTWYKDILKNMVIPLVDTDNVHQLPIVKVVANTTLSKLRGPNDAHDLDLNKVVRIPDEVLRPMNEIVRQASEEISVVFNDLLVAEKQLRENLESYSKGNNMDDDFFMDNFLQLDLYYAELSYQTVKSNIAFTWVSLLSEVGGFMGLLLGASVLTVCEIIDYIFLQCLSRCRH